MRILVLNGSPHSNGATSDMVSAFSSGAMEAGHEVISINVAHKNIKGCMGCEYCREKEKGVCVQKGVENAGIFTANGKQNKSEEKRQELYRFGKSL